MFSSVLLDCYGNGTYIILLIIKNIFLYTLFLYCTRQIIDKSYLYSLLSYRLLDFFPIYFIFFKDHQKMMTSMNKTIKLSQSKQIKKFHQSWVVRYSSKMFLCLRMAIICSDSVPDPSEMQNLRQFSNSSRVECRLSNLAFQNLSNLHGRFSMREMISLEFYIYLINFIIM